MSDAHRRAMNEQMRLADDLMAKAQNRPATIHCEWWDGPVHHTVSANLPNHLMGELVLRIQELSEFGAGLAPGTLGGLDH